MKINMARRYIPLNVGLMTIIIFCTVPFTKTDTGSNDTKLQNILTVEPLHYDVKIEFDMYKTVFFGECNITIQINQNTETLTIRSSEIFAILQVDLIDNNNNNTFNILKFSFSNKTYINLDFTGLPINFLSPGTYILRMIYYRSLLDNEDFFGSLYVREEEDTLHKMLNNNSIKMMKGGELFPCWDELKVKSTFNISIGYYKEDYKFFSNMMVQKKVKDMNNVLWTYFDKSLLMSSVNLIFIITTLNGSSTDAKNITIWCRKEIEKQLQFIKNISLGVVNYLKQKSIQNISKLDYFILTDFPQSSIEMPGIILLREIEVMYNDTHDDLNCKVKIANLVAYRTISNWYYNLFVWSKEGLMLFLTAHVLEQSHLYDHSIELFVIQTLHELFRFDAISLIDSIPSHYSSSFLHNKLFFMWRLLHYVISEDEFWNSVNAYTSMHNVTRQKMLDDMQLRFNKHDNPYKVELQTILIIWLLKKKCYEIYVDRFPSHTTVTFVNADTNCSVLVTYETKITATNYFLLHKEKKTLLSFVLDENDWIIINLHQVGYFRVGYSSNNLKKIGEYLYYENYTGIPVINRAQIVDDTFHFMLQNQVDFTIFWNITSFLIKDTNFVAWYPMIKAIEYMSCVFPLTDENNKAKQKIKRVLSGLMLNLKYDEDIHDSDFTKCLREEAVKWACILHDPECKKQATLKLKKDLEDSKVVKDLRWREWIYCKGLIEADNTVWNTMYYKWQRTKDYFLLEHLGCSASYLIYSAYMMLLIRNHNIKFSIQENQRAYILLQVITRHVTKPNVVTFILEHFNDITISFGNKFYDVSLLVIIITHEHSVDALQQIKQFVKNNLHLRYLIKVLNQKIRKRKLEYEKKVAHYGRIGISEIDTKPTSN